VMRFVFNPKKRWIEFFWIEDLKTPLDIVDLAQCLLLLKREGEA